MITPNFCLHCSYMLCFNILLHLVTRFWFFATSAHPHHTQTRLVNRVRNGRLMVATTDLTFQGCNFNSTERAQISLIVSRGNSCLWVTEKRTNTSNLIDNCVSERSFVITAKTSLSNWRYVQEMHLRFLPYLSHFLSY